ncbi:MAG: hypothetical protein V4621_03705 [Pseudomonadota bacterium]
MRTSSFFNTCATGVAVPVVGHAIHIGAVAAATAIPGSVFGQMAQNFTQSAGMLPFDLHIRTIVTIAFGAVSAAGSLYFSAPDASTKEVAARATCAGLLSAGVTYASTGEAFGAISGVCGSVLNVILR